MPSSQKKPGVQTGIEGGHSRRKKVATKAKQQQQPLPVPQRLERLFTSLCAQIDGGHFSNAVKTCDKILRLEPNDRDALKTKLFLLLQTEQYDAALSLISANETDDRAFEKAYALYRLEREGQAAEVLTAFEQQSRADHQRGAIHLEAQLAYRQGDYQAAFELYTQLLDTVEPQSDEQADILTNLQAAQKHLDFVNTGFLRALDALPPSLTKTLESSPPPAQQVSSITLSALASSSSGPAREDELSKTGPRRVRMKRVPRGVVPGVTPPPDPERWLKKSERSTHMQGKGRKKGGGATQGVIMENPAPGTGAPSSHSQKSGGKKKKK